MEKFRNQVDLMTDVFFYWVRGDGCLRIRTTPSNQMIEAFLNLEGYDLMLYYDQILNTIDKIQSKEQLIGTYYFPMFYITFEENKATIFDALANGPGDIYDGPVEIHINDFLSLLARYREIYYQTVGEP